MTSRYKPTQYAAESGLGGVGWRCWSVVLLKPDCLERGLTGPVLCRIAASAKIVARDTVTVTQEQIFAHYDDLLADPERFAPVDVAADLRRRYVGSQVIVGLAHSIPWPGQQDTAARLRALLGHYDPSRASPDSIRGQFGTDSLAIARSEDRLIDNLIHTSDNPGTARRDFLIWFGRHRTSLLHPDPQPEAQP